MWSVSFTLLVIVLASCSGSGYGVNKQLEGADSLVITFNAPNSDSIIKTVSTTEVKAIEKLSGFLKGSQTEQFKCGYDGNLVFYKQGKELLPVIFKYNEEGCRHFLFEIDNKVVSTKMSTEGESFFKSLLDQKGWY
jgi:hypothetical protein